MDYAKKYIETALTDNYDNNSNKSNTNDFCWKRKFAAIFQLLETATAPDFP